MSPLPQPPDRNSLNAITARDRSPLKFFLVVFALSMPFWLAGLFIPFQPLPGLPVSSLMFFCPVTAALILVYKEKKTAGVTELLRRSFDYQRIKPNIWYAPIVLMMPAVMVLSYGLMRLMGVQLPTPEFSVLAALVMLLGFFIAALGEELGWSGYILEPMQDRLNALPASILLGLVWATWHIAPYRQAHRSLTWIAWQCLFTVALRVLLGWLYNRTGKSVFAATVFHAMANVSVFLFPIYGSYYDPRITGLITAILATLVTVRGGDER
jgi:membrane protease YdiL (CAAX protease family)